jgi:uncharacterized protein (UPF0276 family)
MSSYDPALNKSKVEELASHSALDQNDDLPLSVGLGYRFPLHQHIVDHLDKFDTLEIVVDNYLTATDRQARRIEEISTQIPLVCHGIGLSIGTAQEPDQRYIEAVGKAIEKLAMPYYSEHLAFTNVPGMNLSELLSLPRTEEAAEYVIENIKVVQAMIPVPFLLENTTFYFDYPEADFTESEFMNLICQETGSKMLFDVENLYVNSVNFKYDPLPYIDALPVSKVAALHLAGGHKVDHFLVDDHGHKVPDRVIELTEYTLERLSPDVIILERDNNLLPFENLLVDIDRIQNIEIVKRRRSNG